MDPMVYDYLTDEDKNGILSSHIRSHEYAIYTLEVSKVEAEAEAMVDQSIVDSLNIKISELQSKIAALKIKQQELVLE